MLRVWRVHLPSDIPIVGCELTPHVLLWKPERKLITDDATESTPIDGHFLSYKWYRIQSDKEDGVLSSEQATLQSLCCVKAKMPILKSYHCTSKCFSDALSHHRTLLHERAANASNENANETRLYPASVAQRSQGETCLEVGHSKVYTPVEDDIGHVLKFECCVVEVGTKTPVGRSYTLLTSRVIPAPSPTPHCLISVTGPEGRLLAKENFSVLSYSLLADSKAAIELYSYCPPWALSWTYRRQNLLREIVGYRADIVCLQEVQANHFDEFFLPELEKHGYSGIFKRKTSEGYAANDVTVDGCATFFRKDRFYLVKKYEIEFNYAAHSLMEAVIPDAEKNLALNRLEKDNVGLILVLEAKSGMQMVDNSWKRQLISVANSHVDVQQELTDVKIWQVHTLMKGLDKIARCANIPTIFCGNFNTTPGSAPHDLITMGRVDQEHPDLSVDPLGILRPPSKLYHQLPLASAYSSYARVAARPGLEQHKKRVDHITREPLFTKCTRDFTGTHDYIFYSENSLTVESLLELLDEDSLRKDTALPSPEWSSDHVALLAEFMFASPN